MDMIGRIRRLHSRGKKSEREIARMTGLSRNTVAKWLHGEVGGPPKYRRQPQPNPMLPHRPLRSPGKTSSSISLLPPGGGKRSCRKRLSPSCRSRAPIWRHGR